MPELVEISLSKLFLPLNDRPLDRDLKPRKWRNRSVTDSTAGGQPYSEQAKDWASDVWNKLTSTKLKIFALIVLAVAHLAASLWLVAPGYLSIDEAIYHLMLKNFAATRGFEIWTGYQEFPSWELAHQFLRVHFGRPVSQYPYLFPVVGLPFFSLAGFYGLFILNSLAFVGVVALCFSLAHTLFGDTDLALNSCLVLVLSTFAWEYSQAAWPHMTSLLFIMAAFYLAVRAFLGDPGRGRWVSALGAGLIAGFAPGIRMDAFLFLPCLLLPFLFARPWRPREAILICLGAAPGVIILAITNYIKFGVLSPFSYGTALSGHTPSVPIPLVVGGGGVLLAAWVMTREAFTPLMRHRARILLGVVIAGLVLLVLVPQLRETAERVLKGANIMWADLRFLDPSVVEQALSRTPQGGLLYMGALKKSLLQSMPYLSVLILPLIVVTRRTDDFVRLAILLLPLAMLTGFFAYARDHGGLCLNLRFFLPVLPFTSILTAYALRHMQSQWQIRMGPVGWVSLIALTAAAYLLFVGELIRSPGELEFAQLVVPLLMVGFLLCLLVAGELLKVQGVELLRKGAWALLIVALTWSAAVAFFYDYPRHRRQRVTNYSVGEQALQVVPPDSVFFTAPYIDPFMRLIEQDRVRIALPGLDNFADFPKIVEFYLNKGKRVFAVFPNRFWTTLKEGSLATYTVTPVLKFPGSHMAEISRKPEDSKYPENR